MFLTTHYWEDKNKEKEIVRVRGFYCCPDYIVFMYVKHEIVIVCRHQNGL